MFGKSAGDCNTSVAKFSSQYFPSRFNGTLGGLRAIFKVAMAKRGGFSQSGDGHQAGQSPPKRKAGSGEFVIVRNVRCNLAWQCGRHSTTPRTAR